MAGSVQTPVRQPRSAAAACRTRRRSRRRPDCAGDPPVTAVPAGAWRRAAFALFAVSAGTNVPTPLLIVYRERLDLGPDVLTALFGAYALGLVPALFLAGPASDRFGRKRLVLRRHGAGRPRLAAARRGGLLAAAARDGPGAAGRGERDRLQRLRRLAHRPVGGRRRPGGRAAGGRGDDGRLLARAASCRGCSREYGPAPTTLPYLLHVVLVRRGAGRGRDPAGDGAGARQGRGPGGARPARPSRRPAGAARRARPDVGVGVRLPHRRRRGGAAARADGRAAGAAHRRAGRA